LGRVRKKLGGHYSKLLDTVSGVGYILRSHG
jgi:DNA-binding response OmpR family regulator